MKKKLIITWKPDVLHMVSHHGSVKKEEHKTVFHFYSDNNYKGKTARSEREVLRCNSFEAANKILKKRNRKEILFATFEGRKTSSEKIRNSDQTQCRFF